MLKYDQENEKNKKLMNDSFDFLTNFVFGNKNIDNIKKFKDLFELLVRDIIMVPNGQNGVLIGGEKKGICVKYNNGEYLIETYGYENSTADQHSSIRYTAIHEMCHALVDILSKVRQQYPDGINYNGIITKNSYGAICKEDTNGNLIKEYGVMYNETMMDIISSMSMSLSKNERCSDYILSDKNPIDADNKSAYSFFASITRLTIAAFSNNANIDYEKLIKDGKSIFSVTTNMDDGSVCFANDFLYGIIYDPMFIENRFDNLMGYGKYQELCENFDELFKRVHYNKDLSMEEISSDISLTVKHLMTTIPDFLNRKMAVALRNGTLSIEEVNQINSNFNRIWNNMQRQYGAYFNQNEINNMVSNYGFYYRK